VLPKQFREAAGPVPITGVIIVEASPWLEDNQWILDLAKNEPLVKGVVGNLPVGKPEFPLQLERFAKDPLFRGIRISGRAVGPSIVGHLKLLAQADRQLDVLGDTTMLAPVAKLSDQIPELRIVIDHLPFDRHVPNDLGPLEGRPAVFAKISNAVQNSAHLEDVWKVFGPSRVIYGSNWPVSDRVSPYGRVFEVVNSYFGSKGQSTLDNYFWKNSRSAYRWLDR
jgi:predicted TIM-barrel fold metal-dependent hydrolase